MPRCPSAPHFVSRGWWRGCGSVGRLVGYRTFSNANQQAIGTEQREPGYSLGRPFRLAPIWQTPMSLDTPVPYCGPAPVPGQLTWNADPLLAVCLLIIAALYAWRGGRLPGSRQLVFWCGWVVLQLAPIPPACQSTL